MPHTQINNYKPQDEVSKRDLRRPESAADRVRIVCDLFNLAFEMKSLELERKYPNAAPEWIKCETLRLIELGTK